MHDEPAVTRELAHEHGLTDEEYDRVLEILGRTPTYTELGIFSVMWSEHCSYKNSIRLIKTLPREGSALLAGAGEENAGAVAIGDGLGVVFKIESHNHPSAVEPYQGAATGVGGILRDVFSMGARPIAALNSLHFGSLDDPHIRYLFDGVVRGIGDYGNCFGVPTVGGEVVFETSYSDNPLVNAMAVGVVDVNGMATATASGVGNPVYVVGSRTGRDGIHGATFASAELTEDNEAKRPNVQIGDPFTEKLLLEATLEAIATGAVVGVQDMGAAGLTCCTTEMSERGGVGMDVDLSLVPVREEGMTPYEIMLSESQERMLFVVDSKRTADVEAVFEKWGLLCARVGEVTDDGFVTVRQNGEVHARVPADDLVLGGGAPVYEREEKKPDDLERRRAFGKEEWPDVSDFAQVLKRILSSPTVASKRWVWTQYDTSVRTGTVVGPGGDAAVLRVVGTDKLIAVSTDGNGRYCHVNPREGGKQAVAEAARNVACSGAVPTAVTNCLNFGNPYDPQVYWTFAESVRGMGEGCRAFGTPVTGGNVSFYNESPNGEVYPTPVVGMLGVIEKAEHVTGSHWDEEGLDVLLFGSLNEDGIGCSEFAKMMLGEARGDAPAVDLDHEVRLCKALHACIVKNLICSAHDVSDGGLAVALAECAMPGGIGATFTLDSDVDPRALLFGEGQGRIVVSIRPEDREQVEKIASKHGVPVRHIGLTGGERLVVGTWIDVPVSELRDEYEGSIPKKMAVVGQE